MRTRYALYLPMPLLLIWTAILATAMPAKHALAAGEQIEWSENLAETMKLAQSSGKPVLVHFYGDHCPPCRMLEKKAFKDQQLIDAFDQHILAVRINAEQDTKTAAMFRVNRWPTDVYLYANGDEIYRNISAQDPAVYEKTIAKVAEKNQRWIAQRPPNRSDSPSIDRSPSPERSIVRGEIKPAAAPRIAMASGEMMTKPTRIRLSETTTASVDTAQVTIAQSPETPLPELPNPIDAQPPKVLEAVAPSIEPPAPAPAAARTDSMATEPLPTNIALNGFCPVSLNASIQASQSGDNSQPAWVKGSPEFAVRHRGRIYHCGSKEMLAKFLESPDQVAPVLSGCDLVEYSKSGKWIDGDCRFGFIEQETGRIFLFSSSLNCQEFAQNCEAYSNMVGKPAAR